ncbi:Beta-hexosaminidase subunit alpha [Entamoeba marina]
MPYPQSVSANYGSSDAIASTSEIKLSLPTICSSNPDCSYFMTYNFNHTITFPLNQQIEVVFSEQLIDDIYPDLKIGNDESYSLTITTSGITITAPTVYGARHALETLIQLYRIYENQFVISQLPITITDSPRFKWRGLMIDPTRNVISKDTIVDIVNTLASLKMNVLHLHISDAQTFMFESKKFPKLSEKGSYDSSKILTQAFIKQLIIYSKVRGVIVYPELDMPAHAASWSLGYPGVGVDCWDYIVARKMRYGENIISLNPANENTFPIIEGVIEELKESFGSDYVHVGGDEVFTGCWSSSNEYSEIIDWMGNHDISSLSGLESYFNKYSQDQVLSDGHTPVVWEEVYDKGNADLQTIIQVWSDIRLLQKAVDDGYKAIFSAGFYLDMQMPLCNNYDESTCTDPHHMWVWTNRDFYANDPVKSFTDAEKENVLGGEGCSWGESADDQNFFGRVFTRYSAIAERLWSDQSLTDPESHEVRANYVRCLGLRRNFMKGAGPLYHSYCDLPN